jgi:hypothetical protein
MDFTKEGNTWETYDNVADHEIELLKDYSALNPTVEKGRRFSRENGKKKTIRKKVNI